MKALFFSCVVLLASLQSSGQTGTDRSGGIVSGSNLSISNVQYFSNIANRSNSGVLNYENIEGSPYIDNNMGANKNLPIGKFYSPEFEYIETALVRYNAYTDDMEVSLLTDGVDYYLLRKKPDFLYVVLGETKYRAYETNDGLAFFVILSENDHEDCVLLKKQRIVFKKEEKAESSFVSGSPDTFQRISDSYFFKLKDGLIEIPRNKKRFFAIFDDKKQTMKEFIAANRLKFTKEEDLLQIATYYNILLK